MGAAAGLGFAADVEGLLGGADGRVDDGDGGNGAGGQAQDGQGEGFDAADVALAVTARTNDLA